MNKYKKYKLISIVVTSFVIVIYELFRHNISSNYLTKNTDIVLSSILFILVTVVIAQLIFNTLEKLEKKHYQKEIEAKAIFDNSVDGIFVFNEHGKLIDMNEGAIKLSGWQKETCINTLKIDQLFLSEKLKDIQINRNNYGASNIFEGSLYKEDGTILPVSCTISIIENNVTAIIARDLSERNRMEIVIRDLYKEATQKHYETEILYNISRKMASVRDLNTLDHISIIKNVATDISKLTTASNVAIIVRNFDNENGYKLVACTSEKLKNKHFPNPKLNNSVNDDDIELLVEDKTDKMIIPLVKNEFVLGYIIIFDKDVHLLSMQQKELLNSVKNILSISIERVLLYRKLKDIAVVEERERLAREMHDGLAQYISLIHMKIQYLNSVTNIENVTANEDASKIKETINQLDQITNEAHHEIRQHLFNLRTPFQFDDPFLQSLEKYIELINSQNDFSILLNVTEAGKSKLLELSQDKQKHIIRVIQEALSNIQKHSNATKVNININFHKGKGFSFTISDNGIGFDYQERITNFGHYGLSNMKERARLISGEILIDTNKGQGTHISLTVPNEG